MKLDQFAACVSAAPVGQVAWLAIVLAENSQNQIDILKQMSKEHDRKLLFIYRHDRSSSDLDLIRKSFYLDENKTAPKDQIWRIMRET